MWDAARLVSSQTLVAVIGPTASGKTALAIELAEALKGEVVACDALQIRAGLPLLTAKPTAAELRRIPHHLVGILPIEKAASAAQYAALSDKILAQLAAAKRKAVLCGGSGLYLRALCDGLFTGPPADGNLRARLKEEARSLGVAALHQRLCAVDATAAARIAPADYVRIERALEVYELSGKPLSSWFAEHQAERARGPRYRTLRIGLDPGLAELRLRIAARLERMLEGGLLEEVAAVKATCDLPNPPLGYELVCQHLNGQLTLQAFKEAIVIQTAQYARRQRTWFRKEPGIRWYSDAAAVPISEIVATLKEEHPLEREAPL